MAQNNNKILLFLAFPVGQEFEFGLAGGSGSEFLVKFSQILVGAAVI